MAVTQARLERYRTDVDAYGDAAASYVEKYISALMEENPGIPVDELRDEAIEAIEDALNAFGDQASELALDLLEEITGAYGIDAETEIYDAVPHEMVEGGVRYRAIDLVEGRSGKFTREVADLTRYYIHRSSFENMERNCERNDWRYARVPSGRETCGFCFMLSSRGFVYRSEQTAGSTHAYHANCVLPETKLGSFSVKSCLRRKYEGIVVDVVTRGGRHLSVTPNHPVLTNRGWVRSDHLKDGDALLCRIDGDGHEVRAPNVYNAPPSANEVFEAFRLLLSTLGRGVPAAAVDFDGKPVANGDVEIVDVDGFLENNVMPCLNKGFGDKSLSVTDFIDARSRLDGSGMFDEFGDGFSPASCCVMGGGCLLRSLHWGHLGCPDDSSLRAPSDGSPGLDDPAGNDVSADPVDFGKLIDACSIVIALKRFGRCGDSLASRINSVASERPVDMGLADSELFDNIGCLHSCGVEVDYVIRVSKRFYSGHVYNLSTDGGWYFANDIITHNCDCVIVPGFKDLPASEQVEGYDPDAMLERWHECQDTVGTDAELRERWKSMTDKQRARYKGRSDGERYRRFANAQAIREAETRDFRWLNTGEPPRPRYESERARNELNRFERMTRDILEKNGFSQYVLERSNERGVKTPDILLGSYETRADYKTPRGTGFNSIDQLMRDAGKKADIAIIHLIEGESTMSLEDAIKYFTQCGKRRGITEAIFIDYDGSIRRVKI